MTEQDTFNRLRRKDFREVFEMLVTDINSQTGFGSSGAFNEYLTYAIMFNDRLFKVHPNLFRIIESAYWKPEEFIREGQKRLDEIFTQKITDE